MATGIAPNVTSSEIKAEIENGFARYANLENRNIDVDVKDGVVTLNGNVATYTERHEAEQAAWAALGVIDVANQLVVDD
jgi:osmotically-inducible protein OsmY